MKLFPAKCHERATLRKLWSQTGNSSLLPAKCWPLLHVIAGISAQFSNFAFVLFCYITNHLMAGPLGNSEFCFPRISNFEILGKQNSLLPSGPVIKCLLFSLYGFLLERARWTKLCAVICYPKEQHGVILLILPALDYALCPVRSRQYVFLFNVKRYLTLRHVTLHCVTFQTISFCVCVDPSGLLILSLVDLYLLLSLFCLQWHAVFH